jgi:hypothetical protein
MAQVVMALIPLPTFYNPDEARVRKPVEDEKFVATLDELAQLTHEGGVLRIYATGTSAALGGIEAWLTTMFMQCWRSISKIQSLLERSSRPTFGQSFGSGFVKRLCT